MLYHIEERDNMRFVGLRYFVPTKSFGSQPDKNLVPSFWRALPPEDYEALGKLSDCFPRGVIGVFAKKHDGGFDYWIAAATTKACPPQYETVEIPPAKWIVFQTEDPLPDSIQSVFLDVYTKFFPNSQRYVRNWDVYELEVFLSNPLAEGPCITQAWVPVLEKYDP